MDEWFEDSEDALEWFWELCGDIAHPEHSVTFEKASDGSDAGCYCFAGLSGTEEEFIAGGAE